MTEFTLKQQLRSLSYKQSTTKVFLLSNFNGFSNEDYSLEKTLCLESNLGEKIFIYFGPKGMKIPNRIIKEMNLISVELKEFEVILNSGKYSSNDKLMYALPMQLKAYLFFNNSELLYKTKEEIKIFDKDGKFTSFIHNPNKIIKEDIKAQKKVMIKKNVDNLLDGREKTIKELENQIREFQAYFNDLKQQILTSIKQKEELESSVEGYRSYIQKLDNEIQVEKNLIVDLKKEKEQLRKDFNTCQDFYLNELDNLLAMNNEAKTKVWN